MTRVEKTMESDLLTAANIHWTFSNEKTALRGHNELDAHLGFHDLDSLP